MPSRRLSGRGCQHPFEQETGSEPEGGKVQTNQMSDIPAAAAVIPRTEPPLFQYPPGEIFSGKDHTHIGKAAEPERLSFQQPADRRQNGYAAVNGEHPDRGVSFKRHVPAAKGVQSGKQDFHAPAGEAAFYKIMKKRKHIFFHGSSHSAASAAFILFRRQRAGRLSADIFGSPIQRRADERNYLIPVQNGGCLTERSAVLVCSVSVIL